MYLNIVLVLTLSSLVFGRVINTSDEDVDAMINLLLNGDSEELLKSSEIENGEEPVLTGGMWKCGNCSDVDDSMIVYSEDNDVDVTLKDVQNIEVQISLAIPSTQCVTVFGTVPGLVKRVEGSCTGDNVSLTVGMARHFTVQVYANFPMK